MKNFEKVFTKVASVFCTGKEYPYDHPKIYLQIDPSKGQVVCPYCGKIFIFQDNKEN